MQSSLSAANTIVLSCVSTQKADMLSCKQKKQKLSAALPSAIYKPRRPGICVATEENSTI